MSTFLTAHPACESDQVGVTGAKAKALYDALSTADTVANACRADLGTKKKSRNAAVGVLRKRRSGLVSELKQLLPRDDARWHAFGLNPPAGESVPSESVEHVVR